MSSKLRCEGDARLAEQLLDQPIVKNVRRQIDEQAELDHPSTRRHLLATALRVTQSMSPKLHATADRCAQRLGVSIPLELYVYPAAEFNAACVKPEAGRLFVLLSSALLESFEDDELTFVMGHELGHHVFGHHDIPIGQVLRGKSPPPARRCPPVVYLVALCGNICRSRWRCVRHRTQRSRSRVI